MKKIYSLVFLYTCFLYSQDNLIHPGGVSGSVIWMQTVARTQNLYGSYKWEDYSGDSLQVRYYDNRGAAYGSEYMANADYYIRNYNFNPALSFNRGLAKEILIEGSNLSTATIVGVFSQRADPMTTAKNILTLNGVSGKGLILSTDKVIKSKESQKEALDYGSDQGYDIMYHSGQSPEPTLNKFKERALRSFVYYRADKPNTSVWGERNHSVISLGQKFTPNNVNNTSTFDIKGSDGDYAEAYIPELFIYTRLLSPLERLKVESYLAVKYGFTLERSYINSSGQLIWDSDENKKYHTRVTGLLRDDKSGLFQKWGTTSYEEQPNFSYTSVGDSYERQGGSVNGSRYGLSNRNRLLVIESPSATVSMQDTNYALWGDDDNELGTQSDDRYLGLKIMKRKWLLTTDMGGRNPSSDQMKWKIEDLEYQKNGYKTSLTKVGGSSASIGTMVSENPLPGYEGQIFFEVGKGRGPVLIKFGTPNTPEVKDSHDYGIFIKENGVIYPVIQGYPKWGNPWGILAVEGSQIRLTKTKESIIVSSNGWALPQSGQSLPQIPIEKEDIEKDFYASIGAYSYSKDININNIRAEGFIDTGNRLELSYALGKAEEFKKYSSSSEGKTYLLLDRSGTGNFNPKETELIPSDEYDNSRTKIIFNNVFFDTDHNGKDIFTFAYREKNLLAKVEKQDPDCDRTTTSEKNGKIILKIERGDEGYQYQLYNTETSQLEREGVFFGNNYDLLEVPVGTYTLKIKELGGSNLLSVSSDLESKGYSRFYVNKTTSSGYLENYYKSPQQSYQMGFSPPVSTLSAIYVDNGIEIDQGKIYKITNRVKSSSPISGVELTSGDKIQVENTSAGVVEYKLNGQTIATDKFSTSTRQYYMLKLNNDQGIYNIKHHRADSWYLQALESHPLSETSLETQITIKSDCKEISPEITSPEPVQKTKNLVLYYKDFSDKSVITAKINLKESSALTLAVFDFTGNMVYNQNISESKTEHTIDIKGLSQGVYIVKAITSEGEFTQKMTIN